MRTNIDTTNLRKAFTALRKAGYAARMNYACCSTCGWYNLSEEYNDVSKVVFYHQQGHDRLMTTGVVDLQWSGDVEEICNILRKSGVRVTRQPVDDSKTIEINLLSKEQLQ